MPSSALHGLRASFTCLPAALQARREADEALARAQEVETAVGSVAAEVRCLHFLAAPQRSLFVSHSSHFGRAPCGACCKGLC